MKHLLLSAAFAATASFATAETIRFDYDSEADYSSTMIIPVEFVSGSTNTFAGQYNGRVGLVDGFMDVDSTSGTPTVTDFDFAVELPHGLPAGLIALSPTGTYANNFEAFASLQMNAANGAVVSQNSVGFKIEQAFNFDTRYGQGYALYGGGHPSYDPTDDALYPFKMTLQFANSAADSNYFLRRLTMSCEERNSRGQVNSGSCNGYFGENFGNWDTNGTARNPVSATVVTNQNQMSAVPLPAGLPLLLSGMGVFAYLRRKAA